MHTRVHEVTVNWVEHGEGIPIVALHGAGVDHRDIEAAVEAALDYVAPPSGFRRIYPDLPGMGRTSAAGLTSNEQVVELLCAFLDGLDAGPVALLGHSYGAYLVRGITARRPDLVRGVALLCPMGDGASGVPKQTVAIEEAAAYVELPFEQVQGFQDYFVVRTAETARRYRDRTVPGIELVDADALGRIFANWAVDMGERPCAEPSLLVAGRLDSTAGYAGAIDLLPRFPRASLAVLDNAGHALMHEQPAPFGVLLAGWLERVRAIALSRPV